MKKTNHRKLPFQGVKRLVIITCLLALLSPVTPALAVISPDSASIIEAINQARMAIIAELKEPRAQLQKLFEDALADKFLTSNAQTPNIAMLNPVGNYKFELSKDNKGAAVTPYDLVRQASQHSAELKLQSALANKDPSGQRQILTSDSKETIAKILDAQNFLGPLAYTEDNQNRAELTVAFLSDYASPFGAIDLEKLNTNEKVKDTEAAKTYRVKVYTNAAIRSLLLGNLYDSFNSRLPVFGLAEKSGMPGAGKDQPASVAEVERYTAARRIQNPEWYVKIDNAPAVGVQREMVFILAEIQWQLYQLHRDNEKMLQTMTALGVTNLRAMSILPEANEIDLKQEVDGTKFNQEQINEDTMNDERYKVPPPPKTDSAIVPVPK